MTDIWATDGGINFGFGVDQAEGRPPSDGPELAYIGDRHILSVGPNGSGKSRRLLVPNLARLTAWSVLVVDIKAELAAMTRKHREDHGSKTIMLNPFDEFGLGDARFNPVAALELDDYFPDNALELAESLIRVEKDSREPHWAQSAQEIVAGLIMYSRLTYRGGGSLGHVRELLTMESRSLREETAHMMQAAEDHAFPELEHKVRRLLDLAADNRELSSILSTAQTQTRWLDSRHVRASLETPKAHQYGPTWAQTQPASKPVDFRQMKDRPTTVYLVLPARRLGTHANYLRLMITAVLQQVMRDTRKAKVPVLLMLDEFAQLGHLPMIENNLAVLRGFGTKLWAVYQDLAQAEAIYGPRWESFVANAGVLHSFAPQDMKTAKYLSELTGETLKSLVNTSTGTTRSPITPPSVSRTVAETETRFPTMQPHELRNMDPGFGILFSHKLKGPAFSYLPYPDKLKHLAHIVALDPAV